MQRSQGAIVQDENSAARFGASTNSSWEAPGLRERDLTGGFLAEVLDIKNGAPGVARSPGPRR